MYGRNYPQPFPAQGGNALAPNGERTEDAALQHVGDDAACDVGEPLQVAGPREITNAGTFERLTLSTWRVRPGGDDHRKYTSKGVLC